ncbi:hypothetical protein BU15DRAFT_66850 [Melanogaster broomeanus]|nr:hypothetical protein BU15DRAFT_66850 [Melanogaster broomeanus]
MGGIWSVINEILPGDVKYSADDIPDMTGKVVLVTGSTAGIGKETSRALVIVMVVGFGDDSIGRLAHQADCFRATRGFGKRTYVASREDEASVETLPQPMPTEPGHYPGFSIIAESVSSSDTPAPEQPDHPPCRHFAVDSSLAEGKIVLAPILLLLLSSSLNSHSSARCIFTSDDAKHPRCCCCTVTPSSAAQRATFILAYPSVNNSSNTLGSISTADGSALVKMGGTTIACGFKAEISEPKLDSPDLAFIARLLQRHRCRFPRDVSYGAITQLYAATVPDGASLNGKAEPYSIFFHRDVVHQYLIPWARIGTPHPDTQDAQLDKELWTWLEEQVVNA